jgi:hypothetical protein
LIKEKKEKYFKLINLKDPQDRIELKGCKGKLGK